MLFTFRSASLCSAAALLGITSLVLSAAPANAGVSAAFVSSGPSGGGLTLYNYNILFTTLAGLPGESLAPGNFITLYDLGPVTVTSSPLFTTTQQMLGINSLGSPLPDSPTISNITFTYTGPVVTTNSSFAVSFTSALSTTAFGFYGGQNLFPNGTNNPSGPVLLPAATAATAAPEPGSLLLLLPAAVGAMVMVVRRPRRPARQ